jgi:hypothetical protein
MSEGLELAGELGPELQHLVDLAKDEGDPTCMLMFEEIERMSEDDAKALLAAAVLRLMAQNA